MLAGSHDGFLIPNRPLIKVSNQAAVRPERSFKHQTGSVGTMLLSGRSASLQQFDPSIHTCCRHDFYVIDKFVAYIKVREPYVAAGFDEIANCRSC